MIWEKARKMYRRIVLKWVIRAIRKYFSDGISAITNSDGEIIVYRWAWSKDIEDAVNDWKRWWRNYESSNGNR